MDLKTAVAQMRADAESGRVFAQHLTTDGYCVRAQITQARMRPGRHVRIHVWDGAGRLLKKAELQKLLSAA